MKRALAFAALALLAITACRKPQDVHFAYGKYAVGLKIIKAVDSSRTFPAVGATDPASPSVPRPITIYVWYPAVNDGSSDKLFLEDYFDDMAADWGYVADEKGTRVDNLLKGYYLFKGTPVEIRDGIRKMETRTYSNPKPLRGHFPLIVFGQGWGYESPAVNYALCEYLASNGYVVAAARFLGKNSAETQVNRDDLDAEAADMDLVVRFVKNEPAVDPGRIGVMGFDLGGMAAMLLQIRNPEIKAMVSLHSGIMFGHNIKLLKESPDYGHDKLRVPLLHFTDTKEEIVRNGLVEDPAMIDMSKTVDRYIIRLKGMHHRDFTSLSRLGIYDGSPMTDEIKREHEADYRIICRATLGFLDSCLKDRPFPQAELEAACSLEHFPLRKKVRLRR